MTIERAIEILNPTTESTHSPSEWFQAHNMACQADLSNQCRFLDTIQLAKYFEEDDAWEIEGWPEAENVTVSHWMRLPTLPEGVS